jgi:hypothetical protein
MPPQRYGINAHIPDDAANGLCRDIDSGDNCAISDEIAQVPVRLKVG